MELLAVIIALESLKIDGCLVTVYTDSKYVANAVTKGWLQTWVTKRFKGKKNSDLWLRYLQAASKCEVRFIWIKGHNANPLNERCDALAVTASLKAGLPEDSGYTEQEIL